MSIGLTYNHYSLKNQLSFFSAKQWCQILIRDWKHNTCMWNQLSLLTSVIIQSGHVLVVCFLVVPKVGTALREQAFSVTGITFCYTLPISIRSVKLTHWTSNIRYNCCCILFIFSMDIEKTKTMPSSAKLFLLWDSVERIVSDRNADDSRQTGFQSFNKFDKFQTMAKVHFGYSLHVRTSWYSRASIRYYLNQATRTISVRWEATKSGGTFSWPDILIS